MLETVCLWENVYCETVFKNLEFKEKYTKLNEYVVGFEKNYSEEFLFIRKMTKKLMVIKAYFIFSLQ